MHATTSDFIRLAPANFPSDWHEHNERVLTNHEQNIAWLETDHDQQCTLGKQQTIDQLTAGFARLINTMYARTTLSAKKTTGQADSIKNTSGNENESAHVQDSEIPPAPPSTWVLLRLWRFAKPYKWQLLTGFMLMLGSTAAALVPPYLTMPLMDNVLIPYQNGHPIDTDREIVY